MRVSRALLRDPPPLPADEPAFADEKARLFYGAEKYNAELKMAQFDRAPVSIRRVDWVTGKLPIAVRLVAEGYDTPERAEPRVRELLSQHPRG